MLSDIVPISLTKAVLLGLLQGLTEFLPISSTAHMDVIPQLFHEPDPGAAFSAIVQLGPILAIIAYFRKDLARYITGMIRTFSPRGNAPGDADARSDMDAKIGWFTLFGSIPLMIFGKLLEKRIDHDFRRLEVVAASMIVLAFLLLVAERVGRRRKSLEDMTIGDSQAIGWAQVLALVPGASRSGVTITAGLFQGLNRESAARFSFLLSIPAITAAGLYKIAKIVLAARRDHTTHLLTQNLGPYLIGALVAGLFAYVIIRWFLGYMKEHSTLGFILYRVAFGVALLLLLATGTIKNRPPVDESTAPAAAVSAPTAYAPLAPFPSHIILAARQGSK